AVTMRDAARKISDRPNTARKDREAAEQREREAKREIAPLLNDTGRYEESDFYPYRYLASEGFLPGYNFPRLPLSAYIPARRQRRGRDEFLSRPRFIAISEFGPRAMIYHEGSIYRVNKVNIAFDSEGEDIVRVTMKACSNCGHGHLVVEAPGPALCESCKQPLLPTDEIRQLVRLQNVSAKPVNRITSDEEERQRTGYELLTTYRFSEHDGQVDVRTARVVSGSRAIATLRYGDATRIWRINLGWIRRRNPNERGFPLDVERGYWASNKEIDETNVEKVPAVGEEIVVGSRWRIVDTPAPNEQAKRMGAQVLVVQPAE
ncbi:MAG: hypothetical protein IIC32_08995, partial [Chloroflexi bacterium]|nr:hypothetical protein [Chloroflexota bacterium]